MLLLQTAVKFVNDTAQMDLSQPMYPPRLIRPPKSDSHVLRSNFFPGSSNSVKYLPTVGTRSRQNCWDYHNQKSCIIQHTGAGHTHNGLKSLTATVLKDVSSYQLQGTIGAIRLLETLTYLRKSQAPRSEVAGGQTEIL
jgi:hypothetical protein